MVDVTPESVQTSVEVFEGGDVQHHGLAYTGCISSCDTKLREVVSEPHLTPSDLTRPQFNRNTI